MHTTLVSDINFAVSPRLIVPLAGLVALMVALLVLGKIPLGYNVRNLAVRWRTTILTALAFTLVISLQTVMLAFVNGMYQLTEQSGHPGNVIVLSDGATDEIFSNLASTIRATSTASRWCCATSRIGRWRAAKRM